MPVPPNRTFRGAATGPGVRLPSSQAHPTAPTVDTRFGSTSSRSGLLPSPDLSSGPGATPPIAFTALPTGTALMETGSYTGDGATSKAVLLANVTLPVYYVKIWQRDVTSGNPIESFEATREINDDHASGMAVRHIGNIVVAGDLVEVISDAIITLGTSIGAFTVDDGGADLHPNKNGVVYNYMVLGRR